MLLSLALIGLVGGLVTGISPCIIPVLPVLFFSAGVQAARLERVGGPEEQPKRVRNTRPYKVVAGLVVSFSAFTLVGSLVLAILHLPQDLLVWLGTITLVLIGAGLIFPRFQHLLEKPFAWLPKATIGADRGGFLLGIALGTVYVPCAGPVLAAISVAGATGAIGVGTLVLTLGFAIGAAVPLLAFALAGRGLSERVAAFRRHQRGLRFAAGIVMVALAVGLFFGIPQAAQRLVPDYTQGVQNALATNGTVSKQLNLGGLVNAGNKNLSKCTEDSPVLENCGPAPKFVGLTNWFNTPGNKPLTIAGMKGKVVLVDFWAYSCINCQRSLPHIVQWYNNYKSLGLDVVGIHSPEYAFEKVPGNVEAGAHQYNVTYPVALDNNLSTWTNYRNRFWPADYLIDATGQVRQISLGEGDYARTEALIRQLLLQRNPNVTLPAPTDLLDTTPVAGSITQETYLSLGKVQNYAGPGDYTSGTSRFSYSTSPQPRDTFGLSGKWSLTFNGITPAASTARIRLTYHASEVRIVVSGSGTLTYRLDGVVHHQKVGGVPDSYPIALTKAIERGTVEVTVPSTITVYSFTFG